MITLLQSQSHPHTEAVHSVAPTVTKFGRDIDFIWSVLFSPPHNLALTSLATFPRSDVMVQLTTGHCAWTDPYWGDNHVTFVSIKPWMPSTTQPALPPLLHTLPSPSYAPPPPTPDPNMPCTFPVLPVPILWLMVPPVPMAVSTSDCSMELI